MLAAVRASARAAIDAVDDIVVPTIALLTRFYIQARTPDRGIYEELLHILESMDYDVFVALGGVFTTVSQIIDGSGGFKDVATTLRYEPDADDFVWKAWHPRDSPTSAGDPAKHTLLLQGDLARRAVSSLLGGRRGAFQRDVWPQRPGERRISRAKIASDAPDPDFRDDMIELLTSIWYMPESAPSDGQSAR